MTVGRNFETHLSHYHHFLEFHGYDVKKLPHTQRKSVLQFIDYLNIGTSH